MLMTETDQATGLKTEFDVKGYVIARGLFSPEEAAFYRDHYMRLREQENARGVDLRIPAAAESDPLLRYPRMLQMHRWDKVSLDWLLSERIGKTLTTLLGREPLAVQTMIYYKPPGARGQALHQDNYYLRVQPGTCVAAWMALDVCDVENGGLRVVPGSHTWPLLCSVKADLKESFTDVEVPIPEGVQAVPVLMQPGDVLFFNGQIVHGSTPNRSTDRFRRSLIAHYIEGDSQAVARSYHPVLRFDGTEVEVETSPGGGQCGVWVTEQGEPIIEVSGYELNHKPRE
jgi:ectoine hydroxylase-related dioxygenase (phytanoyl-CoA dioxygenase family)